MTIAWHMRPTCTIDPGDEGSSCRYMVWMESMTTAAGKKLATWVDARGKGRW